MQGSRRAVFVGAPIAAAGVALRGVALPLVVSSTFVLPSFFLRSSVVGPSFFPPTCGLFPSSSALRRVAPLRWRSGARLQSRGTEPPEAGADLLTTSPAERRRGEPAPSVERSGRDRKRPEPGSDTAAATPRIATGSLAGTGDCGPCARRVNRESHWPGSRIRLDRAVHRGWRAAAHGGAGAPPFGRGHRRGSRGARMCNGAAAPPGRPRDASDTLRAIVRPPPSLREGEPACPASVFGFSSHPPAIPPRLPSDLTVGHIHSPSVCSEPSPY